MKGKTTKCRGCDDDSPMTRGQGLNSKFSTVVRHVGDLGPRARRFSLSVLFLTRDVSLQTGSPPSSRVASISASSSCRVLITPKGAESPGSGRIGAIGALVFFPSEAV